MTTSRRIPPALLPLLLLAIAFSPAPSRATSDVVISQIYGGGGNVGSTYRNDFIELFNRGSVTVSLAGMSVQYVSATGSAWQSTPLSGSIAPGQYYLVQEVQGSGGSVNLPTPDAIGTIPMSAISGKVALVNTTTPLNLPCFLGPSVLDLVGFGSATCFEGSGAAPLGSNTIANLRASNGCTDTDNNNADFATGEPAPRNTASPLNVCAAGLTGAGASNPSAVPDGSQSLLTVAVTPATLPTSTGIGVVVDLSSIGGLMSQTFVDNGTLGDVTAGDLVFSFQATVAANTTPGLKSLPATLSDAQGRFGAAIINLTVEPATPAVRASWGKVKASYR